MITPESCPKWEGCSVNICPLDPDWQKRKHMNSEQVCPYLLELSKSNGEATVSEVLPVELVEHIKATAPKIKERWYDIQRICERASKTGSRIKRMKQLRASQ